MQKKETLSLKYSYLSLPNKFYEFTKPSKFINPESFLFNKKLNDELNLPFESNEDVINTFFNEESLKGFKSFAQAYAGHQFGHFTKLGDGRAIIIGEHLTNNKERFDIQLKGSGRTLYSRGGDGKATLKAMLREYIISEAMYYLKIPSSRSLSVIKTNESVRRETNEAGAVLTRITKSHIRVGTFEYAAYLGSSLEDLKALTSYTINRLYPEIEKDENPALSLLNKVMAIQINLVVNWMRVGFIHGVMNTDNTSISGETFDYGPCAFMNTFHPNTVYSSIDRNGRYAFDNQPKILKWNLSRFAETLLPIIHDDKEEAIKLAQTAIDGFDEIWKKSYYGMMLNKIGINKNDKALYSLVDELLDLMKNLELDYTNTFWTLSQEVLSDNNQMNNSKFKSWLKKWNNNIEKLDNIKQAKSLMRKYNPVVIPRNHLVEQAIEEAVNGNTNSYQKFLSVLSNPYQYKEELKKFMMPPSENFENSYKTYCGT